MCTEKYRYKIVAHAAGSATTPIRVARGTEKFALHQGPFNFEEQRSYPLKEGVVLNTGHTVTTTRIFDSDTNRNITFGERTSNEMCFDFALYYPRGALSCGLGGFFPGRGG